jgi:hypothetical protein
MKNYSADFVNVLSKLDWSAVLKCNEVENSWGNFKSLFLDAVENAGSRFCGELSKELNHG